MSKLHSASSVVTILSFPLSILNLVVALSPAQTKAQGALPLPQSSLDTIGSTQPDSGFAGTIMSWIYVQPEPAMSHIVVGIFLAFVVNAAGAVTAAELLHYSVGKVRSTAFIVVAGILGGTAAIHAEYMLRKLSFGAITSNDTGAWVTETRGFILAFWAAWLLYSFMAYATADSAPESNPAKRPISLTGVRTGPAQAENAARVFKPKAWLAFTFGFGALLLLFLWNDAEIANEQPFLIASFVMFFVVIKMTGLINRWGKDSVSN